VTDETTVKATAAKVLRAVADLIDANGDIPVPGINVSFYLHGVTAPALMTAIATALPCEWHSSVSHSGTHEWLNLDSKPRGASIKGASVHIAAPAADVCVQAGERTITVWQPAEALTGLLGTGPLGDDQ
jgi:hypothetical protein